MTALFLSALLLGFVFNAAPGAVFLLNEPYTCAHHRLGRILYGALVGAATMGFRYFGVYETGVCFALLAVNSVSALIDRTEVRLYRLLHRLPSERKEAAE